MVSVGEAMTPSPQVRAVAPGTPILEVLQILEGEDVNQVPVVKGGQLVGMLTRDHILRVLSAKMELDVLGGSDVRRASAAQHNRVPTTGRQ